MADVQSKTIDFHNLFEEKQADQTRPSTRPSTTFRSVGRQKNAHWSNRFRKDVNDLIYDVKYNLIKGKADLQHKPKYRKNIRNHYKLKESSASSGKLSGISIDKYKNRIQMMKKNQAQNPQKFNIQQKKKYSTVDTQGLCKFQYEKTISGRLVHKSNHHLGFQFQTDRSVNLNAVWHAPSSQINNEINIQKMQKKTKINKSHGFDSYTQRRVFQPRQELDKFYDSQQGFRLASTKTIKQTYKLDGVLKRKDHRASLGTQLNYNDYDAKMKIMSKICSYKISPVKRELTFSRQVISPQRGCYR